MIKRSWVSTLPYLKMQNEIETLVKSWQKDPSKLDDTELLQIASMHPIASQWGRELRLTTMKHVLQQLFKTRINKPKKEVSRVEDVGINILPTNLGSKIAAIHYSDADLLTATFSPACSPKNEFTSEHLLFKPSLRLLPISRQRKFNAAAQGKFLNHLPIKMTHVIFFVKRL